MLRDITLGQYYPIDSIIHRLDPRLKILASFAYIIALFIVKNIETYTLVIAFLASIIFLSKVPLKYIIKGLKPILLIIVLTFGINIFMTQGELLYRVGPFKITREGIEMAIFMSFRLIFLIIGTSLLTLTTPPIELTDGIERCLNPFKRFGVPAHELAMMMTIALRFIPTLLEETDKIMKAQMARGADFESGNLVKRAKSLIPLLVPLFIGAFRRADDLAMAMEARCYRGGKNRTRMKQLKFSTRDYVATAVVSGFVAFIFIISYI